MEGGESDEQRTVGERGEGKDVHSAIVRGGLISNPFALIISLPVLILQWRGFCFLLYLEINVLLILKIKNKLKNKILKMDF